MDSSKAANWLQIIGNLGLIVGLVLVAVQIRQSNDLAKAQLLSDGWLAAMQWDMAQIGEDPAASIARASVAPHHLTDEDLVVLEHVVSAHSQLGNRVITLGLAGYDFFPREAYASRFAEFVINSPFGMAWWNENRHNSFRFGDSVVADLVDRRLTELGTEASRGQLANRERIRAYIAEHWSPAD